MAGSSFFALLDDIATLLDDVSVMTKVAAKKTAGVLGDDLALNAQQVAGVQADRELPVVWAVAKGSLVNKVILVPLALLVSWAAPWAITPLLMLGGLYLCFEGVEKIVHVAESRLTKNKHHQELVQAVSNAGVDMLEYEREKIRGAIRTDFVLSAEIIVITLGTVAQASLPHQLAVLSGIALLMTAGVYGLVAGIVKLDDAGFWMRNRPQPGYQLIGNGLLALAPRLMKALSVAGTVAMFLVGGGILLHGLPALHHAAQAWYGTDAWSSLWDALLGAALGVVAGALMLMSARVMYKLKK
ncbi:MAG: inner membrane protein YedI [Pseudomonadota bacterium]|jgi:predicted DNA repair protein MutK